MKSENLHDEIVITIDESFSILKAIKMLRRLYKQEKRGEKIGIFFKFTLFKVKVGTYYIAKLMKVQEAGC